MTFPTTIKELQERQERFEKLLQKEVRRVRHDLVSRYGLPRKYPSCVFTARGGQINCGGAAGIANAIFMDVEIRRLLCRSRYVISWREREYRSDYGQLQRWVTVDFKQDPGHWNWPPPLKPPTSEKRFAGYAAGGKRVSGSCCLAAEAELDDKDLKWWQK